MEDKKSKAADHRRGACAICTGGECGFLSTASDCACAWVAPPHRDQELVQGDEAFVCVRRRERRTFFTAACIGTA